MWQWRSWFLLGLCGVGKLLGAEIAAASDALDSDGRVEVGANYGERFQRGEILYKAKLRFTSPENHGMKARLKLSAEHDDPVVRMEEAYIRGNLPGPHRLEVGLAKKRLGQEYHQGADERPLIRRSLIYQRLETLAYVGRQPHIRYRYKPKKLGYTLAVAVGAPESLDNNLLLHVTIDDFLGATVMNDLLLENDRLEHDSQRIWVNMTSFLWPLARGGGSFAWEAVYGVDSLKTEYHRIAGGDDPVYFFGNKLLYNDVWLPEGDRFLAPTLALSQLVEDTGEVALIAHQLIVGLDVRWPQTRLGVNLDFISRKDSHLADRNLRDSRYTLLLVHYF